MGKLILDYIEFRRTIFRVKGRVDAGVKEEDFYLYENSSGRMLPLKNVLVKDKRFDLEIPMLAVNNESPLETGHWYICIKEKKGTLYRAYVTDDLYDKIYQYELPDAEYDLMVEKGDNNYFYAFSKLDEDGFAFYLQVDYSVPEKTKNIFKIWISNVKKRHKYRLSIIRKGVFSLIFCFFNRVVKKTGNKVLFTSDSRVKIGGNEEFVYNKMIERGMDKDYVFRFSYKERIGAHRSFKDKILFTYYLATSDYIFLDDYQPEIYLNKYDPSVKVIQVWHACGAFKTLGFERLKMKGAPPFNTRVHKCYTHVPVSSEHSAKHHAEAFAIDESKFYPVGIPRTDVFFDPEYKQQVKENVYSEFPQLKTAAKVILYAPTFRGENARNAYFPMHVLHFRKIGEYLKSINGIMIVKMHPFVKEMIKIPEEYKPYFIDASSYREVNDILFVTYLLITDYSSVIYEMALLNKPMLFYAFDLKQYVSDRGFYEPYEDIVPGKIVKTLPALLRALREEDYESEKLEGFISKNFKYTDGKATDRVIDLVFGEQNDN